MTTQMSRATTRTSVFYTSIEGEIRGFQIAASSAELTATERHAIETNSAVDASLIPLQGRVLRLYPAGTLWAATAIHRAGRDYTGREGNVLAHTILLEARDVRRPVLQRLVNAGCFVSTLPAGQPAGVVVPPEDGRAPDPRPATRALGAKALTNVVAWLAGGGTVALVVSPDKPLGVEMLEAIRAFLPEGLAAGISLSTANDSPRFRIYSLDQILAVEGTSEIVEAARADRPDLAVLNVSSGRWVSPRAHAPGALAYAAAAVRLATSSRASPHQRIDGLADLKRWLRAFAPEANESTLPDERIVEDAATYVLVKRGLQQDGRPWRKRLICLLAHVAELDVADAVAQEGAEVVAEAAQSADVATIVNMALVVARHSDAAAAGACVANGLARPNVLPIARPLGFELFQRGRDLEWPSSVSEAAMRALAPPPLDGGREGWVRFTPGNLDSFFRHAPQIGGSLSNVAGEVLDGLNTQASRDRTLVASVFGSHGDRVLEFVPAFTGKIVSLHETAHDSGVADRKQFNLLVERLVLHGEIEALATRAGLFAKFGVPDEWLHGILRMSGLRALVRQTRDEADALVPTEGLLEVVSGASARARGLVLLRLLHWPEARTPGDDVAAIWKNRPRLSRWLRAHPSLQAVAETIDNLRTTSIDAPTWAAGEHWCAPPSRDLLPHLGRALAPLVAVAELPDDPPAASQDPTLWAQLILRRRQVLRAFRRLPGGWQALIAPGGPTPELRRAHWRLIGRPRCIDAAVGGAATALVAAGATTAAGAIHPILDPTGDLPAYLLAPSASVLLLAGGEAFRHWNKRVGRVETELMAPRWELPWADWLAPTAAAFLTGFLLVVQIPALPTSVLERLPDVLLPARLAAPPGLLLHVTAAGLLLLAGLCLPQFLRRRREERSWSPDRLSRTLLVLGLLCLALAVALDLDKVPQSARSRLPRAWTNDPPGDAVTPR